MVIQCLGHKGFPLIQSVLLYPNITFIQDLKKKNNQNNQVCKPQIGLDPWSPPFRAAIFVHNYVTKNKNGISDEPQQAEECLLSIPPQVWSFKTVMDIMKLTNN